MSSNLNGRHNPDVRVLQFSEIRTVPCGINGVLPARRFHNDIIRSGNLHRDVKPACTIRFASCKFAINVFEISAVGTYSDIISGFYFCAVSFCGIIPVDNHMYPIFSHFVSFYNCANISIASLAMIASACSIRASACSTTEALYSIRISIILAPAPSLASTVRMYFPLSL